MESVQLVRILLVGTSSMFSNIVTAALAQAHDLVVVGNIGEHDDLFSQIRQTSADAIIVQGRQPGAAESFAPLLRSFPALTVVAIDPTGSGFVHQLRPYSVHVAEFSADVLQSVLRTGFGYNRTSPTPGERDRHAE
jgi:hypothetical protein